MGAHVEVSGPTGTGVINIVGRKTDGVWLYEGFRLTVGEREIDLTTFEERSAAEEHWAEVEDQIRGTD